MKTALDLLVALRTLLPELACDQSTHTWQSFKLDPSDLDCSVDDLARNIVAIRKAEMSREAKRAM